MKVERQLAAGRLPEFHLRLRVTVSGIAILHDESFHLLNYTKQVCVDLRSRNSRSMDVEVIEGIPIVFAQGGNHYFGSKGE